LKRLNKKKEEELRNNISNLEQKISSENPTKDGNIITKLEQEIVGYQTEITKLEKKNC